MLLSIVFVITFFLITQVVAIVFTYFMGFNHYELNSSEKFWVSMFHWIFSVTCFLALTAWMISHHAK